MESNNFKSFLSILGHSNINEVVDSFTYTVDVDTITQQQITIPYFYFSSDKELFNEHLKLWNQNSAKSFIAVFDNKTYIIDLKQKPDHTNYLPLRIIIKSFDYGVNTANYDIKDRLRLISKEGINSSEYFNFVFDQQQRKKSYEVDKDLLLNLLALRKDLSSKPNDQIDLLLLRCLFVKYLEDRGAFLPNTLLNALSSRSSDELIKTFTKVRKINGDLFSRTEFSAGEISPKHLEKLSDFFGYTDYQKRQIKFFLYQFDKIPIQLISHIYESFLSEDTRKGSGIYYTPSFLVDFMLSQTLQLQLEKNKQATILDPSCGSGIFLVSAFRMIIKANIAEHDYDKKKKILQYQLFGIDLDERALQIAAFSLYLALLEGEDPKFIQDKIKNEFPILPSLIGKNLLRANALIDDVTFELPNGKTKNTFDCIAANPPWGSVPKDNNAENIKTRDAIGNKSPNSVSGYHRSQAFLVRTSKWSNKDTMASMVVNNSIFFNENSEGFRRDFLNNYQLEKFYELSDINKILFKKRLIGKIRNNDVYIGANEPCCVLVYKNEKDNSHMLQYISPKLNDLSENLRLIAFSSKDIVEVEQKDLQQEDLLWKIFVSGNWSEYQIIKKRILEKDNRIKLKCQVGFIAKANMKQLGSPKRRTLIVPTDFARYYVTNSKLRKFDWSQNLHRSRKDETIYTQPRILIPVRPLASDKLRLRGIYIVGDTVFKDNIACIRIYKKGHLIEKYKPYLAIINSKFVGFLFYQVSSQWGKGNKRVRLSTSAIENIPFPSFEYSDSNIKELSELVSKIERAKSVGKEIADLEEKIDQIVFDLYNLTEYERKVVNDFYEVFYREKNPMVNEPDLDQYANRFCNVFRLMLSEEFALTFTRDVSINMGAVVCFKIQNKKNKQVIDDSDLSDIRTIVKNSQTKRSYLSYALSEEKVKHYDKEKQQFYIIKSNQFRDWTERQAIDDANEEIGNIINYLKGK